MRRPIDGRAGTHQGQRKGATYASAPMEAAFFDLDKTVIAKASMVAFGGPLYRAGLISRWLLLAGALRPARLPLPRRRRGAARADARVGAARSPRAGTRRSVARHRRATRSTEVDRADRLRRGARAHPRAPGRGPQGLHRRRRRPRRSSRRSPEYLGVDEAIATRAELDDDGRYTGEVEFYAYGPYKAEAMREVAGATSIDLAASYAYSDSATDMPMLEAVGHPVAVNPDRELLRVAPRAGVGGPPLRAPGSAARPRAHAAAGPTAAVAVTALAGAGAAFVWWKRHRSTEPLERSTRGPRRRGR